MHIRNLPESARKQLKGHNAETVGKLYEAAKAHAVADMAKNPTKEQQAITDSRCSQPTPLH